MSRDRDDRLGEELRALPVPEHRPGFFADVAARLQPRHRRPPVLAGLAAAAVIAAVLAAGALLPRDGTRPPDEIRLISAGEVRTRVSSALSSLRTLSGELTVECEVAFGDCFPPEAGGRTIQRWSFATTAAGDERISGIGRLDDVSYSVERREQRARTTDGAQVITNLPAGPPDFAARPSVLRRDVASVVRAFLAATSDVPVTEISEQGRPAWWLVTPIEPNKLAGPGASGDQLEVVVDRQTGFPLRVRETLRGRFLHEVRLSNLVVDAPVDPARFLLDLPVDARPFRQDAGFRSVPVAQLAPTAGYQPVLPAPTSLPPGYQLAEVTVAAQAQPTGTEGANPPSRRVVSVAYRRGFDRIVVTTRATGTARACPGPANQACWADPLASGEGIVDQPQRFTVGAGALAGARAELVVSPRGIPHVWTFDDRLVVTVAGDATPDELRRMADAFAPATG